MNIKFDDELLHDVMQNVEDWADENLTTALKGRIKREFHNQLAEMVQAELEKQDTQDEIKDAIRNRLSAHMGTLISRFMENVIVDVHRNTEDY